MRGMAMAGKAEQGNATALFIVKGFLIFLLNLIFYVVVIFCAVWMCKTTYSFANEVFGEVMAEAPPGQDKTFVIETNQGAMTIAKNLEEEGLISNAYSFYVRLKLSLSDTNVVTAGTYTLNTSMTYEEILAEIVKKVSVDEG
jgi:cell division protein YceG involved in septum cleavage